MDRLFVFPPGFLDRDRTWFCPYSAQVIGYLAYFPEVRSTLEIVELDFAKPRHPLVDLVGDAHQSAPCLVLDVDSPREVEGVTVDEHRGVHFVSKTIEILRYLAATRGSHAPH